jgi:hypothetical protein
METTTANTSGWAKIPLLFAAIHFFAVVITASTLVGSEPDALYQAVWFPLTIIDFPVSLIIIGIWMLPVTATIHKAMLVFSFPWSDFSNFWVPLIVFGIFGTLWWFYLARFIVRIFQARREK